MDKAFLDEYFAAYNSEDSERLSVYYADDVVVCYDNNTHIGKASVLETYRYIQRMFEDRMTVNSVFVQGDKAVVEIENRFVARRDAESFLGRDLKQGESFVMYVIGEFTFANGEITEVIISKK